MLSERRLVSLARLIALFCDDVDRLAGTLSRLLRLFPFLRKRFLLPLGKNLPFLSLGKDLASFLPLATLFLDLTFLRFRLRGIN